MTMEQKHKIDLITRNLQEVVGQDIINKIILKRPLNIYWGTATTGKPHIAYFLPIYKIKDFVDAGCNVTILLADIHAFLDNLKSTHSEIENRTKYYKKIIILMLKSINVDISKVKFVLGSSYQKSPEYFNDIMKILSQSNINDCKRAGSEVVKQTSNVVLSSLVYPAIQALDEEYLKVDVQFGGIDQRKIFMFAREKLQLIKYKKRGHLMNTMIGGLNSDKMSSSDINSKIDLLDSEETIKEKISGCRKNGLSEILRCIVKPWCEIHTKEELVIGGKKYELKDLDELEMGESKEMVADIINRIVEPVRKGMMEDVDVIVNAYGK